MDPWAPLYRAELAEYQDDSLWSENGICPYVDAHGRLVEADYPWTCGFCTKLKRFCCLQQSEDHLLQKGHCNQIFWEYGNERPALPKWQCGREAAHARAPGIPPAPSPPTSMIQFESRRWRLINAAAGGSAADAALAVDFTCETTTYRHASRGILQAPTDASPGHSRSCAPPPPPRVGFEGPTGYPSTHLAYAVSGSRSESLCVPTPAVIGVSAPVSHPRSALRSAWVGNAAVLAKAGGPPQTSPSTSPKAPPPLPPHSTINGVPIACAALTVNVTRETTTPAIASRDILRASISCEPPPARCGDPSGSPPFALPPRVDAEDTTDHLRTSPTFKAPPASSRSMALSVPAPAGIGMPAPASSSRPPLRTSLPGMAGLIAKQPSPGTSPKPPPPTPTLPTASDVAPPDEMQVPPPRRWGAPADAS